MKGANATAVVTLTSLVCALGSMTVRAEEGARLYEYSLADLGKVKIYTASRALTSVEEAPSVVTVITNDEIQRRGYKNLKEVLDRVPGFFNSPDESLPLIATRGYVQNPNNNILLLVDGHPINSVIDEGIGATHMLPFLYQVKRVEIIRGPGSTLWGGDAASGIINLITYDGKDLAEGEKGFVRVSGDYEFNTYRTIGNALYGGRLGDNGDIMVSLTGAVNDAGFLPVYAASTGGAGLDPNIQYKWQAYRPSYELHAKANLNDFTITARSARVNTYYRQVESNPALRNRDVDQRRFNFDYVVLGYNPQLSDSLSLESNVYENVVNNPWRLYHSDGTLWTGWDASYRETGLNAILTWQGLPDHRLKGGVQMQRRDFKGQYIVTPGSEHYETPVGIERATGIFAEDTYSGIKDWIFVFGARREKNDFRQASIDTLYRGAAIWQFTERWTLKYMYNSGVVPSALTRARGTMENPLVYGGTANVGPKYPQTSHSQDLQALFSDGRSRFGVTLFLQDMKNFIARPGNYNSGLFTASGVPIWLREMNVGTLTAHGIELEAEHRLDEAWLFYGNYAYAKNKVDKTTGQVPGLSSATYNLVTACSYFNPDGQTTGVPEHLWNMGFDWAFDPRYTLNEHYRGWNGAWGCVATNPLEYKRFGTEHFLDINLLGRDVATKGFTWQAYVKNLFDNRDPIPSAAHGKYIPNYGREVGIGLSYTFQ